MTNAKREPAPCAYEDDEGRCPDPAGVPGAARGYCRKHYARLLRHGHPGVTLITIGNDPQCTREDCGKPHLAKGLCSKHYAEQREARMPACAVEGCELHVRARGWCNAHYHRWLKFGDVLAHVPLRGHLPAGTAWCARCKALKPHGDFRPASGRPNGLQSYCRGCSARLRATRYRNRILEQQRRWRRANPEAPARYGRNWRTANPGLVRAKAARQKAANPERYRLYARSSEATRRARKRSAPGKASGAQIAGRWAYYGNRCWICGAVAEVTDHVKPLAKGGSNWPANLRPACWSCNNSKRARWPFPLEVARAGRPSAGEAA